MKIIIAISLLVATAVFAKDDDRLTINRLGYGVFFERIGEITDSGGMIYHPITWSLLIPEFETPNLNLLDCQDTSMADLDMLCKTVNSLITKVNSDVYTQVNKAKRRLAETVSIIPLSNTSKLISEEEVGNSTKNPESRRFRRSLDDAIDEDVLNPEDPEIPDWITNENDVSSNLEYFIPGRLAGDLFTNIFSMPSSSTIKNAESNLRALGGAIYTNTENIKNLGTLLQYVMQVSDKRMDALQDMSQVVYDKLVAVNDYMRAFQTEFYDGIGNITLSLMRMNAFKTTIVSDLYPELNRITMIASLIDDIVERWTFGIINLTSGYISQYLVSEELISNALDYIKTYSLKLPNFSTYRLMSNDPAFYYKLTRMAYARAENKILVTLDIPLFKPQKRLTLYRISSFPMPVKAGQDDDDVKSPHGFTYILDLPEFIAVTENLDAYVELTEAQYLACEGPVKGIQSCGNSVGIPKLTTATHKSCAYSIFSDTPQDVKEYCQTAFTKDIPQGSARQLSSDSSFLIQGGGDDRYWTMTCPGSSKNPQTKIEPCSLCRLKVACGCSLFGTNFRIPTHISGCDQFSSETPVATKIYQQNVATLREFVTDLDLQQVSSYEESIGKAFPAFEVPEIKFTVPDHLDNYIEISRKYASDFAKGAELIKKNLTIFKEKVDEALVEARNFTDQEVDRAGSVLAAIKELFDGLFGGEVWRLISAIFSPIVISGVAFILALIMFIPEFTHDVRRWKERRSEDAEERELLMNYGLRNGIDMMTVGYWPAQTSMLPVAVRVKRNQKGEEYFEAV